MKKLNFLFLFFSLTLFSQSNFCSKKLREGFFPLNKGFEKNVTWYQSIHNFVTKELKKEAIKLPKEDGDLIFKVSISKTGEVYKVKSINSIKGGRSVRNKIVDILKRLPRFNPTINAQKETFHSGLSISIIFRLKGISIKSLSAC